MTVASFSAELEPIYMAPPHAALLLLKVQLAKIKVPASKSIAPPLMADPLITVILSSVTVGPSVCSVSINGGVSIGYTSVSYVKCRK